MDINQLRLTLTRQGSPLDQTDRIVDSLTRLDTTGDLTVNEACTYRGDRGEGRITRIRLAVAGQRLLLRFLDGTLNSWTNCARPRVTAARSTHEHAAADTLLAAIGALA